MFKLPGLASFQARSSLAGPAEKPSAPARGLFGRRRTGLAKDERGVAAIEFAFIAPIMIAMLIGIIDTSNAVSMNWRMVQLNRTLADLTSQSKVLTAADLAKITAASTATLTPYTGPEPTMIIASIVVSKLGVPFVCWGWANKPGALPFSQGDVFALPNPAMKVPGTSYIISKVIMTYDGYISPNFNMTANWLYYKPRAGIVGGASGAEQVTTVSAPAC